MMDVAEVEESLFAASDAKLHVGMCRILSVTVCKILEIFPVLEAARPRSMTGIQALCSLHVALEKAKNLLQHCSDCSKLYLAITGDSVLLKFEKARCALMDSLKRVEDIVAQAIGCQILEIVDELQGTIFSLDPSEKQIGDEVIQLLQKERKSNSNCNENSELETFHQAASRLGITSSKAALTERRALKKLLERARIEEDKRKESIVAYLLHLMRKYSKLFRSEVSDGNDSQGSSTPCSPSVQVSGSFEECSGPGKSAQAFERQHSKLSSLNFMLVPPEELRCPISLRLMCDPVIISSGQTYERVCIERWFNDGHTTCPKTQQQLSHLCLTPNYCVKGLISSWCEQNGVSVPDSPPDSLDLNYWSLALSECNSTNSISMASIDSCKLKGVKAVPLEDSGVIEEFEENILRDVYCQEDCEVDMFERYESLMDILCGEEDISRQCEVVEQIRIFLKVDEEARIFLGANGFVDPLVRFLSLAIHGGNEKAQEIGAMALFNLAVNNNRNKRMMLSAGIIPLLEEMICNSYSFESSTALYLNLSCLEEAKPIIGSSPAVPFLIRLLKADSEAQCKLDSLHALYNLSTYSPNIPNFLSAGIIEGLQTIVNGLTNLAWVEKAIGVIINLATNESVKEEMISAPGIISGVAAILDSGEPIEQEHVASCLLVLCNGNEKCSEMVLQEGVIPSLVSISVNGTNRGKDKAQKLLKLFREQRQRESLPVQIQQQQKPESSARSAPTPDMKPPCKSTSKKMSKPWSSIWKSKNFSVHQC